MALGSNVFDLLGEGSPSSHTGSLLSIVDDVEVRAAFEAAEKKRREEAKEALTKRKDEEKKLKEAARKKKEKEEEAERNRKEQEEKASMERRLENRRRWFESQERKEEEQRWWADRKKMEEENEKLRKKMEEEDGKLRKENPEKWEAESKRRETESLKAAVLGLLRPRLFSRSPSPLEFQRGRRPGYKQGEVQGGAKPKQVPRRPSTLSDPSDIGSMSGHSGSASTRPSTSQGSQRSEAEKTSVKPAIAASLTSVPNGTNSQKAEAIKINGPAVKAATGPVKKEAAADNGSDKAIVPTITTNPSSSSDQVQESEREGAMDNVKDGDGWQLVASRRRRKQGSDARSNSDQVTDAGHVNVNGSKDADVDGNCSTKSSDGRSRQKNKSEGLRINLKKNNAKGEKKEAEVKAKKDNGNFSSQQPQPKKVTVDVNRKFRTPQVDEKQCSLDNGDRKYNKERQRFNNGGPRYNKGEHRLNNGGRRYDNGGQRSNNEGRELQFSLDNADEFPTIGRK